ncbi:suppressor of fused domain protein [Enemella evansiae]|uniref:suppressor of fused domain protein n=1 Tax=Enemella evansiae TaxID=2016499 RepID=UPI001E592DC3|nr:suppressor of fused domain protein [Enemella evansiae]
MTHVLESDPTLLEILDLYSEQEAERASLGGRWVRSSVPLDSQSPVARHLESYLGRPSSIDWAERDGTRLPFKLASFLEAPIPETSAYSTLGLSRIVLDYNGRSLRQELVMLSAVAEGPTWALSVLTILGEYLVETHDVFVRGQVIGPRKHLPPGSNLSAVISLVPFPLPEGFAMLDTEGEAPVVFVLLVPITLSEMAYIEDHGPGAFEQLIDKLRPQLSAFRRQPIV